jgi:hypothetical protein
MKILKLLAGLLVAATLIGCGTTAVLQPGSSVVPSADESVIVIGLNPLYTIHLNPGEKVDGGFKPSAIAGAVVNGKSTNGYIVARVRPGQVLGLTSVFKENEGGFGTKAFTACGARALVFEVPRARSVYYLTDIEYAPVGNRLNVRYHRRLAAAEDYLRTIYPNLRGDMEQLEFEYLPALGGCGGGTVTIPIYIGR